MSNLASRLLTAFIGGPILIAALYLLPVTAFFGIAAVAMSIAAWELFAMTHPDDRFGRVLGTVGSLAVFTALVATAFGTHHTPAVVWTLVLLMPTVLLISLFRPDHIPTAMNRIGALVMGPMYLGPSMAALALVRAHGTNTEGAGLALLALLTAWFSDTGGYFAGKFIGGPKLYPAVSPNKTWAGAVGGAVGSMLAAVLASTVFLPTLPLVAGGDRVRRRGHRRSARRPRRVGAEALCRGERLRGAAARTRRDPRSRRRADVLCARALCVPAGGGAPLCRALTNHFARL
jgi:phosphatidate cytidylyltransferase